MIFVTTGTQFTFERLLSALNHWCKLNPKINVIAQTGLTKKHYPYLYAVPCLSPLEYFSYVKQAELIIGHAGTGTIITAQECNKPLIVLVRDFGLNEHRDAHQQSTIEHLSQRSGLYIANTHEELFSLLNKRGCLGKPKPINFNNYLIDFISQEID